MQTNRIALPTLCHSIRWIKPPEKAVNEPTYINYIEPKVNIRWLSRTIRTRVLKMASVVNAQDIDTDFLPFIYDVIRSLEKESNDSSQKSRDTHETYQKIIELKTKLMQCKELIQKLNGIDYNKEDQIKRLDALRKQLIMKRELLLKYRNMCHFDTPK